jgi:replicative DNA helicase
MDNNNHEFEIIENIGIVDFSFFEKQIEILKQKNKKLDWLVIDYLDHIKFEGYKNRWDELGAITLGLKSLASKYNLVIITAQQQNRTKVDDDKIDTRYISGSDKIGAIADFVCNIRKSDNSEKNKINLFVCKNRFGDAEIHLPVKVDYATLNFSEFEGIEKIAYLDEGGKI